MNLEGVKRLFVRPDLGLLILRLAAGALMILYGWGKFSSGNETLRWVGSQIEVIGIAAPKDTVFPLFYGILAAGTELVGGILLVVGWFVRPAAVMIFLTMIVATLTSYQGAEGDLSKFGHPLLFGLVMLAILFTGPGRISIQKE